MRNSFARRLKKLEALEFQYRAELGPSPAATLLERRRKRALAEGLLDSKGRSLSLADVLLQRRVKYEAR
jgi:hypothetical protein